MVIMYDINRVANQMTQKLERKFFFQIHSFIPSHVRYYTLLDIKIYIQNIKWLCCIKILYKTERQKCSS